MPIYLIHGDSKSTDPYLIRQRMDDLLDGIERDGNLNFTVYDLGETGTTIHDVVSSALTLPFLGGQRVVVAKGAKAIDKAFVGKTEEKEDEDVEDEDLGGRAEEIVNAIGQLKDLPKEALLIFLDENQHLDGRTAFYRALKKVIKKVGGNIESYKAMWFDPAADDIGNAVQFIQSEASRMGLRLEAHMAERFARLVGSDRDTIMRELEKLALYAGSGSRLTDEDIENAVTPSYEAGIFQLVDLIGQRKGDRAIEALYDLFDRGAAAPYILTMIARQMRLIAQVREAIESGVSRSPKIMAKTLGQSEFVIRKIIAQERRFPPFHYSDILDMLMDTDVQLKRGTMPDVPTPGKVKSTPGKFALELLITQLTTSPATRARV